MIKKIIFVFSMLASLIANAQQFSISGKITSQDGNPVSSAEIKILPLNRMVLTNENGFYSFGKIDKGSYQIEVSALEFSTVIKTVTVKENSVQLNISLQSKTTTLDSVTVNTSAKTFGITRLKDVDENGIYAGKKSEVIVMKDISANLATNNSRQIYGKIAGLNIYENDGGAGIQLAIGGRGLDPNRVSNFNTRQNGYDISADALGYPESYYTPPAEVLDRIEIVRGAASLEYGTQFGGIINFKMKDGNPDKKFEITQRLSTGSWGFFNSSTSIGGTSDKWKYYAFFQHKSGNGWRPNSKFNSNTGYFSTTYKASEKFSVTFQYTHMDYLEQQPGGLPDSTFERDPRTSTKARNWFKVNWNLGAILLNYTVNQNLQINSRVFGLAADRSALGIIYSVIDPGVGTPGYPRDYRTDAYRNWGDETRVLYTYNTSHKNPFTLLVGARYYHGYTDRQIGKGNGGSTGTKADFAFDKSTPYDSLSYSQYKFPNHNVALFAENIFRVNSRFSIIPGVRYENIYTKADGFYNDVTADLGLNVLGNNHVPQHQVSNRSFLIGGIGFSYDANNSMQFYANISQNYKGINFNNESIVNSTTYVDPNLKDEKGYSADIGIRGHASNIFTYDLSLFTIYYNNRIGIINVDTIIRTPQDTIHVAGTFNTNVSASRNWGVESFGELDVWKLINGSSSKTKLSIFSNLSLIDARYVGSKESAYRNKKVELVPPIIFRSGITFQKGKFTATYQYSYIGKQFGDATNAVKPSDNGIYGVVPSYYVMDFTADFKLNKIFQLSGTINNLSNHSYFTRRADSYPGPGIIPADPRSFYITAQIQL